MNKKSTKRIIIIGAGGHAKVIADIIKANEDELIGFLDDDETKSTLGRIRDYIKYPDCHFVVGIGNIKIRKELSTLPVKWHTAIHPSAVISDSVTVAEGTVIMPNVVINSKTIVGRHCIINTSAVVEHDNIIGDYSHISAGVKLGGTVSVGNSTWIDIGAVVKNNILIADNVIVSAGAVVVRDILEAGIYWGIPASRIDIAEQAEIFKKLTKYYG